MIGAEGKLFRPLAFTKTMALTASLIIALFLIPPIAAFLFRKTSLRERTQYAINGALVLLGILAIVYGFWLGLILIAFAATSFLKMRGALSRKRKNLLDIIISSVAIVFLLAEYWRPLGFDRSIVMNLIFVSIICFGLLGVFSIFRIYYERILRWALQNRYLFLIVPATVLTLGILIMRNTGKEFMPALNEGSFLLMPTSLPHAGVEENKRVLQQLDMAVASIPEIETVVGKAGRTESALDPAPLSMYCLY
jgi:Cu(I)/Ag(I) efflux system membrane protein CusA/SilA